MLCFHTFAMIRTCTYPHFKKIGLPPLRWRSQINKQIVWLGNRFHIFTRRDWFDCGIFVNTCWILLCRLHIFILFCFSGFSCWEGHHNKDCPKNCKQNCPRYVKRYWAQYIQKLSMKQNLLSALLRFMKSLVMNCLLGFDMNRKTPRAVIEAESEN